MRRKQEADIISIGLVLIFTRILPLVYIFQFVESGSVKYMPVGYDRTQDKECVVNTPDTQPSVIY